MRIDIPSWSSPSCFCGCKMVISVDVVSQIMQVKCPCCGLEQYEHIPFDVGILNLQSVYDIAHSIME